MSSGSFVHADVRCLVRFHDTHEESAAWRQAIRSIERDVESAPSDCSTVDVRVDGRGASIELHTLDGRAAERRVQSAAEAPPLVRALLIGFDQPIALEAEVPAPLLSAVPPEATEPVPEPEPVAVPEPSVPDADTAPPEKPKSHVEVFAAVNAGLELQQEDDASPVGQAIVGISLRAWQAAAFAKWELEHHQDNDSHIRHSSLDAFGGGGMFGRRQTVGPITLVYGTSLGVYSAEQARGGHREQTQHIEAAVPDPRGGIYLGALFPTMGRVRTRAQIDGEVAFLNHSAGSNFPNVPQWGMGLSLGVDFGLLP